MQRPGKGARLIFCWIGKKGPVLKKGNVQRSTFNVLCRKSFRKAAKSGDRLRPRFPLSLRDEDLFHRALSTFDFEARRSFALHATVSGVHLRSSAVQKSGYWKG